MSDFYPVRRGSFAFKETDETTIRWMSSCWSHDVSSGVGGISFSAVRCFMGFNEDVLCMGLKCVLQTRDGMVGRVGRDNCGDCMHH